MDVSDLSHAQWRTSSRSGANGQCVQVAFLGQRVAVRDSKNPDGAVLLFTPDEWKTFTNGLQRDEFEALGS